MYAENVNEITSPMCGKCETGKKLHKFAVSNTTVKFKSAASRHKITIDQALSKPVNLKHKENNSRSYATKLIQQESHNVSMKRHHTVLKNEYSYVG